VNQHELKALDEPMSRIRWRTFPGSGRTLPATVGPTWATPGTGLPAWIPVSPEVPGSALAWRPNLWQEHTAIQHCEGYENTEKIFFASI